MVAVDGRSKEHRNYKFQCVRAQISTEVEYQIVAKVPKPAKRWRW